MYSVKLYERLSSTPTSEVRCYQLSSRLIVLASTLDDAGRLVQSFHVSCMALRIESRERPFIGSEIQFLLFLFDQCSCKILPKMSGNRIYLPQITKATCLRMVGQLSRIEILGLVEDIPSKNDDLSSGMGLDRVFAGCNLPPLRSIIAAFRELRSHRFRTCTSCQMDFLCFIVEVMILFGQSMLKSSDRKLVDEHNDEIAFHTFRRLFGLLCEMIDELEVHQPQVFKGVLSLAACSAILQAENTVGDSQGLHNMATKNPLFRSGAVTILRNSIGCSEGTASENRSPFAALNESVRLSQRKLLWELSADADHTRLSELVTDCIYVADGLINSRYQQDPDKLVTWARECTLWTVADLQSSLEASGDQVGAIVLSCWTLALSQDDISARSWFASSVFTGCLNDGCLVRLSRPFSALLSPSLREAPSPGTADWIFEKEYLLCEMRIATLQSGMQAEESFKSKMQKIQAIREEAERSQYENDESLLILKFWLLSTVFLVELDTNVAFGCYTEALESSQRCLRYCQAIMKRVETTSARGQRWIPALAASTVLVRVAQRYSTVMSRRPKLYYRIGDHRKAAAYMRSTLDLFCLESESSGSINNHCAQLDDLIIILTLVPARFKTPIRQFLEVKSWGSTPERIHEGFLHFTPKSLVRQGQDVRKVVDESFVQSVLDLVAGKNMQVLVFSYRN
jgi:hypothetical protein